MPKKVGGLSVIALSAILIIGSHFTLLTNPNNFYLGTGIDGFKNYYTLIYHIKYDTSYSHFEGMNYPYGEHVVFTDNQPLLSNTLKFVSNNIVDISGYTVGIMNILMLLSILATCWILYLIFRQFKIPDLWAVLFAIGIGFMAPQIHRMSGHYALSYGFVIPLCFLLWLRFYHNSNLRNSIVLGVFVLLCSLIHMYYFAIMALFLIFYLALSLLQNRNLNQLKFSAQHGFVQVLIPLIILQLWFFLTDPVTDRPSNPYGFLQYRAFWQGIFLPITYPIGNLIHSIKPIKQLEWEGIAYVGLIPGILFFRYALISTVNFIKSKGKLITGITKDADVNMLFYICVLVLAFSSGVPFIFNLEFLVDYLGPLKQFRSIARFSWVFYFGMNTVAFIVLYRLVQDKIKTALIGNITLVLAVAFLFYEANMFHNTKPFYSLATKPELEQQSSPSYQKSPILEVDANDYQAILPLPYFHGGSENIGISDQGEIGPNLMTASILSGLPTTAVMMSRTSLSQTLDNVSIILEPYGPYNVINDFPSGKPLLLWIEKNENLSIDEQRLVEYSTKLYENEEVRLAALDIQKLYDLLNDQYSRVRTESEDTNLYLVDGFRTRDSVLNFYHEYEMEKDGLVKAWMNNPSQGNIRDKNVLFESTLPLQAPENYTLSLWVKFHEDLHPTTRLFFDELNEKGDIVFGESWTFGELVKLLDYDWALIEYKFTPQNEENTLRFTLTKESDKDMTIYWNNLLIRPSDNDIFHTRGEGMVFKNGRTYGPDFFEKPVN